MFGLGLFEVVTILAVALVVLGPERLPQLARQLARLMGDARRMADDVRRDFDSSVHADPEPPKAPKPLPPPADVEGPEDAAHNLSAGAPVPAGSAPDGTAPSSPAAGGSVPVGSAPDGTAPSSPAAGVGTPEPPPPAERGAAS